MPVGARGRAREGMRARWASVADRRRALDAALDEGGELDLFRAGSEAKVTDWLASGAEGQSGRFVVTLSSNDPEDLTLRTARLLGQADAVVYDAGVAPEILSRARADAVRLPSGSVEPESGVTVILKLA